MKTSPSTMLREAVSSPHLLMWLCFGAVIAGAWGYLFTVSPFGVHAGIASDLLRSLCLPDDDPWSRQSLLAAFVMWSAMVLAMMLPSAAPMLSTYMDIAEAADEKAIEVASPFFLVAGYLSVWLVFSVAMMFLQGWLQELGMLTASEALSHPGVAAAMLLAAGGYQFSSLKHACHSKCANPMPWFLANWRDDVAGVYQNGLRQGGYCLGCCWAMMLVMFVAGLMNLFWMAAIGLVMIAEKTIANPRPVSYASGWVLILGGVAFAVIAIVS